MIFITLGETLSVNIEILGRLQKLLLSSPCPLVLIGSHWQWQFQLQELGLSDFSKHVTNSLQALNLKEKINFLDIADEAFHKPAPQLSVELRGALAFRALQLAAQAKDLFCNATKLAFITGPIDKSACSHAGFQFSGQTEFFEQLAKQKGIMVLAGPKLRVGLATNHVRLLDVSGCLNQQLIIEKLKSLSQTVRESYGIDSPKIAVTGLNPHCSDNGLFGNEEATIIAPAIKAAIDQGINAHGPLPADTSFFAAYQGSYDAVLAMYHDQGLGPLKTVHFFDAINITGGLPFLRVSPDHGPAADLYGKHQANTESFENSITHAYRYIKK